MRSEAWWRFLPFIAVAVVAASAPTVVTLGEKVVVSLIPSLAVERGKGTPRNEWVKHQARRDAALCVFIFELVAILAYRPPLPPVYRRWRARVEAATRRRVSARR